MTTAPTRLVLVLMSAAGEYQVQATTGIARTLRGRGIPVLAVSVSAFASRNSSTVVLDLIRREQALGVIALADVSAFERPDLPEALTATNTPTVTLGVKDPRFPRVGCDNRVGMRQVMRHLLEECDVRRPALVRGIPGHLDSELREQVFREECAAHGIEVDEGLVVDGMFQPKPAYEAFRTLLARRQDFDAVVALNDPSAQGVVHAASDHGLRVPDDFLITGFDNVTLSDENWPPLTTVDQELELQGSHAAEILLQMLAGEQHVDDVQVASRLVVRTSTRRGVVDHDEVMTVLRSQQARLMQLVNGALFSGDMADCGSVQDVIATLEPCLVQAEARRCFLSLDESAAGDDGTGPPATLVFSYRDGRTDPPTGERFPRHHLLPSSLWPEFDEGIMLLQPLAMGGREHGHLLHDINMKSPWLTATLHVELPRTIDTVLSAEDLREHAATLEKLVAQRTLELEEANAALQRANATLRRSAMLDGLTGIANRKAFQDFLDDSFRRPGTPDRRIALLMIDVDMFKAFNDRYGHLAGDDALRTVASCLRRSVCTPRAMACRYGGEEFAVIVRDCDTEEAMVIGQRFLTLLAQAAIRHEASPVAPVVTASVGIAATATGPGADPIALIDAADQALYQAKLAGRHRIVVGGRTPGFPRQRTTGDGPVKVWERR